MTIKLIKRKQQTAANDKPTEQPTPAQLMVATKAWVDEFKAQKAREDAAMLDFVKRH